METAIAIVNLFNAVTPGVANLIVMIKRKDGTVAVLSILDEADSKFDGNLKQATDWLQAHKQ